MYVCGKIQSALKEGCRKEEAIKIKCVLLKKKLFQSMQIASRHVKYATMYLKSLQGKNCQKVFPEGSGP